VSCTRCLNLFQLGELWRDQSFTYIIHSKKLSNISERDRDRGSNARRTCNNLQQQQPHSLSHSLAHARTRPPLPLLPLSDARPELLSKTHSRYHTIIRSSDHPIPPRQSRSFYCLLLSLPHTLIHSHTTYTTHTRVLSL
jgi:hypothetical protein